MIFRCLFQPARAVGLWFNWGPLSTLMSAEVVDWLTVQGCWKFGTERLELNTSGSPTGEVLAHNVVIAVLVERLFQEIHNPPLNDLQVGFASSCQPDSELRPWHTFMASLKEKWEYLDFFTFKAILKVIIRFGELSFPGAVFAHREGIVFLCLRTLIYRCFGVLENLPRTDH